ncbi:traB domain-containing protein-like protein, partial [Dinothrombium tinctorium]
QRYEDSDNSPTDCDKGVFCDEPDSSASDHSSDATFTFSNREENPELPETVTVLDAPYGGKVYLVGTSHFSEKSIEDVEETIKKTQPNVVVLELCESRLSILALDEKTILEEAKSPSITKLRSHIKEHGLVQGVMYVLLLTLTAHLTKELGMAPGGEFRRAFKQAKKVPGCLVHLGDRPVHITLRRAISSLPLWQKLKLAFSLLFNKESITKEEVEKCKQRDLLEEMLAEITGEFPALGKVFVEERDIYLAYSLQLAASPIPDMYSVNSYKPAIVVGVVGIGHVPGIVKNWSKVVDSDIPPLLTLPQRGLISIIIGKSVKYSFFGLLAWGCYKLFVPTSVTNTLLDIPLKTIEFLRTSVSSRGSII